MLVKTEDRWTAVRALMNTLLKDERLYCNWCGQEFRPYNFPCCENPQLGRHIDHVRGVVKQNRAIRETRLNEFGSTKDKSLRWGISMPPKFLSDLETAFKMTYGEKLFRDAKDLQEFMKEFPAFRVCNRV